MIQGTHALECIQFKRVKNCLMFMKCIDWVCPDWTLDVVFIVLDGM